MTDNERIVAVTCECPFVSVVVVVAVDSACRPSLRLPAFVRTGRSRTHIEGAKSICPPVNRSFSPYRKGVFSLAKRLLCREFIRCLEQ